MARRGTSAAEADLNSMRPLGDIVLRKTREHADQIRVIFDGLEGSLVDLVNRHDVVFGCVAWLTSKPILRALAAPGKDVSLVVQKEDFLRPDVGTRQDMARWLRPLYDGLRCSLERHQLPINLSVCSDPTLQPVRCVGNHNSDRSPAFPRMHHKFALFGVRDADAWPLFRLHCVWTGSFNFTANGTRSLENAVIIFDPAIVAAYFREYQHVLALSERLDWTKDWCEPEWRIGT